MTLREEVSRKIGRDALLARLRQKIDSGKGTYADSFAYSDRAGKLLGEVFSRRLPDIPPEEREALCAELLHDRYTDINSVTDSVQKAQDAAQGLHLAPQHAPFNNERAHQIGSATADQTVPVETQQRRAKSATATMTRAMHDDRMKAEAKFRSRAGLKCYITRMTDGKCCPWCSKVAGRYEYGREPDGIYRRHDNCSCTVTFENGRKRQDVWSKREWEAPKADAGAPDPVRLTPEQTREREARHPLIRFTPEQAAQMQNFALTNGANHARIRLGINLFDPSDELYVEAFSIEEEAGFTDIYLHGSPSSVQITVNGKPKNLTPAEFEQLLKSKGINGGDIRLCSCSTGYGDDSFARQLSEIHNGKVKAPDSDVYYAPDEGTVFNGDPNANVGKWRIFEKGAEIND